jgi:hypothetical protein
MPLRCIVAHSFFFLWGVGCCCVRSGTPCVHLALYKQQTTSVSVQSLQCSYNTYLVSFLPDCFTVVFCAFSILTGIFLHLFMPLPPPPLFLCRRNEAFCCLILKENFSIFLTQDLFAFEIFYVNIL